jgi:hypothetical protein
MCQYQGRPFEWETETSGAVRVKFRDSNGEVEFSRPANQEELDFIKTILVMRKISQPPYVLKLNTHYSSQEINRIPKEFVYE